MEKVLSYDQIVSHLVEFCHKSQDEEIKEIEATKILNQMSMKNGHQEFNYEIAVELFERVASYNTSLTIQTLAHVIYEANDIIINKYNHAMNREMYMEEQKAYLKHIKPYGNTTNLQISYVKIQEAYVHRPYIVVLIGEFIHESEIQTRKDGWFEWSLDIQIPVKSLVTDLKVELLEDHNIIASLQIPYEALPMNEMKEAELQMQNANCHTLIQLQCMLSIGNNYKELIDEKMQFLDNQTQICQEELFLLQSQLHELSKPFFRDANIQPKQINYSNKSQLNTEIFQNIPDKSTLQPPSLQATAFRNTSSALGFKKIIIEPERKLHSYPIMARIDLLATLIAIISMMINFFTPDISVTFIMVILFSIMLKHKYTLIYILILVTFGIIIEIFTLSYLDLSIFAILLVVLNMLLNFGLFLFTGLLLNDVENVSRLKSKLLQSNWSDFNDTTFKYLYDIAYGERKVKNRIGIVVMLISGYAGFNLGTNQSEKLDTSSLYQFNGQDEEIYNLLQTKPVLQLIYPPGEPYFDNYRTAFIKASNKFNQVHFVLVNTNQHFQYCRNIDLSRLPQGLLWLPQNYNLDKIEKFKQEGVFPVVEYLKEYSVEGIECFLMENGVIPQKKSTDQLTQQIKTLM